MNDSVRERIVRNNYTFREANEQIRAKADEYDAPIERIPFLCECPVPSCTEVRAPTSIRPWSPRSTAHGQTDASGPMLTRPMTTASGWTKAVSWI